MTIITKPLSEKKGDKLDVPLVTYAAPPGGTGLPDVESGSGLALHHRTQRVSNLTTCCLLLTALAVVGLGIIGGSFLYDQYMRVQMRSALTAQIPFPEEANYIGGWSRIPIDDSESFDEIRPDSYKDTFQQQFEFNDNSETISVPDFKNGRNGRFIHDFNTNITGIIDITGNRCFVMPLNRGNILPPKSLFDLLQKMWAGHYNIDTRVVRETMRVVTPPISDPKSIGTYIGKECEGKPIYKLEKYVGGVVKRSADHEEVKFAQFAGKGILEFDIVNMDEVSNYEKNNR